MRFLPPAIFFLISAGATIAAAQLTGPTHGAAFSAIWLGWIIAASTAACLKIDLSLLAAVALGSACGPLSEWLSGSVDLSLAAGNALIAVACAVAAAGIVTGLCALRFPSEIAALIVIVLGVLWFGWPIWASPYLAGREDLVSALSWAHPLLSADAAIVRAGSIPWSEHTLMYRKLTVLQQHVFPRPPTSIWPALLLHGLLGGLGILASTRRNRPQPAAAQGEAGRVAAG